MLTIQSYRFLDNNRKQVTGSRPQADIRITPKLGPLAITWLDNIDSFSFRVEVSIAVKIHILVFWVITSHTR
jgi:hypothetical protein